MTDSLTSCPTSDQLKAFVNGSLPDGDLQTVTNSAEQVRQARHELNVRSIFLTPISGRWFLFSILLGMAGTLAIARFEHLDEGGLPFGNLLLRSWRSLSGN